MNVSAGRQKQLSLQASYLVNKDYLTSELRSYEYTYRDVATISEHTSALCGWHTDITV